MVAWVASLLLLAPSPSGTGIDPSELRSGLHGPRGTIRVRRPLFAWEAWPADASPVVGARLWIDGRETEAAYDATRACLWHRPAAALATGTHEVRAELTVQGNRRFVVEWRFAITPDAAEDVASASPPPAFEEVNRRRAAHALPPLTWSAALTAVAEGHAAYLAYHRLLSHAQSPGVPGFFGATPNDRAAVYGHPFPVYEAVAGGDEAVDTLFDAPYHRVPFLVPGSADAGWAAQGKVAVLLVDDARQPGFTASPSDGATDVPVAWGGREQPDPFRIHPEPRPQGYPIVFSQFGREAALTEVDARLEDEAGRLVPCVLNHPGNDEALRSAAILTPVSRLDPGATYRWIFRARTHLGESLARTGRFRTASSGTAPQNGLTASPRAPLRFP